MKKIFDKQHGQKVLRILYHHRTQGEEPESIHIGEIVAALTKQGAEVRIVGPASVQYSIGHKRRPTLFGKIKTLIPNAIFELLQLAYNLIAAVRIVRVIWQFQPDLIYERYALFSFTGVFIAKFLGIPFILEVNTPYAQVWSRYYKLHFKALACWLEHRILCAADQVITVTEVQKALLIDQGVDYRRINVCHNAIDPERFAPDQAISALLKDVAPGQVVVGFVGTMNRWQGMEVFPDVLRDVLTACPCAFFLIVGDGEYRKRLENFCRANGLFHRVRFTGRQPHSEIPALVSRMDIAILLNTNAWGSPMKLFEYMAMGKAIIAPRVGSVMEIATNGKTAILIDAGHAQQMIYQIVRLTNDSKARELLGKAARSYVITHHTWDQNAMTIKSLYRKIQKSNGSTEGTA